MGLNDLSEGEKADYTWASVLEEVGKELNRRYGCVPRPRCTDVGLALVAAVSIDRALELMELYGLTPTTLRSLVAHERIQLEMDASHLAEAS